MITRKPIIYLILSFILTQIGYSQQKTIHNRSKQLIEHYNKLRRNRHFPVLLHDTVLDNVANEVLHNELKYRGVNNELNEDSIRFTFYNSGVVDYIYEILDIPDSNVTAKKLKAFFLVDSSRNIRIGYSKYGTKKLLIKTNGYLKYEHGECFAQRVSIDGLHNRSQTIHVPVITDSVKYYLQIVKPGQYYYQYSDHIPKKDEILDGVEIYNTQVVKTNNKDMQNKYFDLVITSRKSNMYVIITNEKNKIVGILK
jgi:hypothetical protein